MRVTEHPIRIALRHRGSTLRWFSQQVGLEESRVNRILRGDRPPTETFYADAERVLGIPVEFLRPADLEQAA